MLENNIVSQFASDIAKAFISTFNPPPHPRIVYIAGKITGDPDYRVKFGKAQTYLEEQGYTVINPALLPGDLPYESYHPICCAMIDASDEIHMLRDWSDSPGAKAELLYAMHREKEISTEK